ncbi:CASP-like protein 4B1 isoform X1 [Macadamia integrifolia]|uniref:CASP-like protein 4B1 isoform X1 n=1 Tax=Macadamia integrifolia TaxID=60698 RepID=UPI001C533FAF|nr:CASP-like protein 4B1 isoform X1 [Macadamia integrifolia]
MSPMNESENNTPQNPAMARSPADMENQSLSYAPIVGQQWRKEDIQVVLRVLGLVTSIISFVVMARNSHGLTTDGLVDYTNNFYDYDVYRYLLAVGIISTVYCKAQVLRQFCNGMKPMFTQRGLMLLDFFGDQVIAYLLISGGSSAIQTTRDLKSSGVILHSFTDSSAASISMAFLAFGALALSAIISAFKLSS